MICLTDVRRTTPTAGMAFLLGWIPLALHIQCMGVQVALCTGGPKSYQVGWHRPAATFGG